MRRSRLLVTGASGSGTTTLARAVADAWAVPHADSDDYFWVPSDPPFTQARDPQERLALMDQLFLPREAWVVSGSLLGWGDDVVARCDGVVFLTLSPEERMRRLEAREQVRRERGQWDDAECEAFLDWARSYDDPSTDGRSRAAHEAWLATLTCPILRLDSAQPRDQLLDTVLRWTP